MNICAYQKNEKTVGNFFFRYICLAILIILLTRKKSYLNQEQATKARKFKALI